MTKARSTMVNPNVVGTYHCMSRCVRGAFLCGKDPKTNRNYDHRKIWLEERLAHLASFFLIDIFAYAIVPNHIHLILRNRPDLANKCSDREVILRWHRICPVRRVSGLAADLTESEITELVSDQKKVTEWRSRLSSISWLMALWKQPISRRANIEDGERGHFWEYRFKCVALLDQAAILTCMVYVDLNPIRAGIADRPEHSRFTSIRRRILARQAKKRFLADRSNSSSWLAPIQNRDDGSGILSLTLEKYLELVDWSGRQVVAGKVGAIPKDLAPILQRLEIDPVQWHVGYRYFGSMFYRVAGRFASIKNAARAAGVKFFKGKVPSRFLFS